MWIALEPLWPCTHCHPYTLIHRSVVLVVKVLSNMECSSNEESASNDVWLRRQSLPRSNHAYYFQVQTQMFLCVAKSELFCHDRLLPELLGRWYTRLSTSAPQMPEIVQITQHLMNYIGAALQLMCPSDTRLHCSAVKHPKIAPMTIG